MPAQVPHVVMPKPQPQRVSRWPAALLAALVIAVLGAIAFAFQEMEPSGADGPGDGPMLGDGPIHGDEPTHGDGPIHGDGPTADEATTEHDGEGADDPRAEVGHDEVEEDPAVSPSEPRERARMRGSMRGSMHRTGMLSLDDF